MLQTMGEFLTSIGLGVPGKQWDFCSIFAFYSPLVFFLALTGYDLVSCLIEDAQDRKWRRDRKRRSETFQQQELPYAYESKWDDTSRSSRTQMSRRLARKP